MTKEPEADYSYDQSAMAVMESDLLSGPIDAEVVRRYYDSAVFLSQLPVALEFFQRLQERYPRHQQIRSLYISICLQLQKYDAAMAAIETMLVYSTPEDGLIEAGLKVRQEVDFRKDKTKQRAEPTLTVCMIARDEQAYICPCLHSIKKIADEIVVVDTGSKDRTTDLARVFGAQVHNFYWQDDFSLARNFSLKNATGNWIFIIDADEVIASEDMPRLKRLIFKHSQRPAAFSFETRNYTHVSNSLNWQANKGCYPKYETGLGWFPSRKIRLFPNLAEIQFQYPVHELVDPSIKSAGLPCVDSDIPVHHYGHLNNRKNVEKAGRYFKLGYAKLDRLGNDVVALRELAVQAEQLEYWTESLELWQRLLKIRPNFIEAHVNISGALWQLGRYEEALPAAQKALTLNPTMKEAKYNLAISLLLLGRVNEALSELKSLCKKYPDYLNAQFMMALSFGFAGDFKASKDNFEKVKKATSAPAVTMALQKFIHQVKKSEGLLDLSRAAYIEQVIKCI